MSFWLQLRILVWKNFVLRKRQLVRVVVELVWPLCLFLILLAVRFRPDIREKKPECHYEPRAMPSAGTLAFYQSYACSFDNKCNNQSVSDGILQGNLNLFNASLLEQAVIDFETLVSNGNFVTLTNDLGVLTQFVSALSNSTAQLNNVGTQLSDVIVDRPSLLAAVANQSVALSPQSVDTLLNATFSFQTILTEVNATNVQSFITLLSAVTATSTTSPTNQTVQDVQTAVCADQILLRYLTFTNQTAAEELQTQLCNLTPAELFAVSSAVGGQVNQTLVTQELTSVVNSVTGQTPTLTIAQLTQLATLGSTLESLQPVLQDFTTLGSALNSQLAGGSTAALGSLLCGGSGEIFGLSGDNEQNLQNEVDRQTSTGRLPSNRFNSARQANLDSGLTETCASLFATFEETQSTRILWRQLKPLVLGEIPFTPNGPAARALAEEASQTFNNVKTFFNFTRELNSSIPAIEAFLENDIEPLRDFFGGSTCTDLVTLATSLSANPQLTALLPPQVATALPLLSTLGGVECADIATFINRTGLNDTYTWRNALNNTQQMLNDIIPYFECYNLDKFVGYDTVDELVGASLSHIDNNTFLAAVVFDNIASNATTLPTTVKYRIRMDTDKVDNTKKIRDKYYRPGPRDSLNDLKYFAYWFIYVQDMLDHAIIRLQTNVTSDPGVYMQQMPYPCWIRDKFIFAISRSLPLFMVISWIYSVAMIVKGIVYEKEMRLKEVMKIMGLGNGVHWVAWFINSFIMMLITVILFVIILKYGLILEYSDVSIIFFFLIGFALSTIGQCFLISTFFNKANLSAVCGGFIYFVLYLPYTQLAQFDDVLETWHRMLACLSSNVAMGYACNYFAQWEEGAIGATWSNFGESPAVDDTFNLRDCIFMLYLDAIIYFLLTWYLEAVFPGEYGIPRKPWFFVQKSYWFPTLYHAGSTARTDLEMSVNDFKDTSGAFEKDPVNKRCGVSVQNLRKVYNKGEKVAVDGLSLNFYEGQITSFLGHNGAGKTTTMSILTGLFPPTSGTAYVYDKNIMTDIESIRGSMGMCPQHNVLFDFLTVEEHIWFYAKLKGRSNAEVDKEMGQMINDVGLANKRKEEARNLSGGMKRKLSVAIAFVGGSRTVILDEPTAGVDPYARRSIWELLLKFRKGRTIILSTHHMDEADVLGDRIAIISHGKLKTIGSSLFLKNRYGSGYYLTLVRGDRDMDTDRPDSAASSYNGAPTRPGTAGSVRTIVDVQPGFSFNNEIEDEGYEEKDGSDSSIKNSSDYEDGPIPLPIPRSRMGNHMVPGFSISRLTAFVQKFVSSANLVEDNQMEVCFRLPEEEGHSRKFQDLFAALEMSHHELGVSSYGISDTSLEEVFLRVAEEGEQEDGMEEQYMEKATENGRYPRRPSRHSISKKKTSLFKFNLGATRVGSNERLTNDTSDAESVADEAAPDQQEASTADVNFSGAGKVTMMGKVLVLRQLMALFLKRFHHMRRSKKGFISEIILPAGFVCLAMMFSLILPAFSAMPPLELQPWMYEPSKGGDALTTFYSQDNPLNALAVDLESTLLSSPYYGTRCMDPSQHTIGGKGCRASNSGWSPRPVWGRDLATPTCSCDSGFQRCPGNAGGPRPSMNLLQVNDNMHNVTDYDVDDWLVKTLDQYRKRRYGGFSLGQVNPLGNVNGTQLQSTISRLVNAASNGSSVLGGSAQLWSDLGVVLQTAYTGDNVKVWFNNKGWAASVSYMGAMNNVILRALLPDTTTNIDQYGIVAINHPMNLTKDQLNEETLYSSQVDVVVAICVIFAMSFVPASFILFLIEERVSNSKHLQFVSGINPTVYWLANWAWDMLNYSIPAILCILIFLAFGKEAYTSAKNFPCLLALMFLYGWSITPMMYPFSRLFDVPSSAFVVLSCANVFIGTVSTLATFILELLQQQDPDLKDINDLLKQVFLMFPHYCLGRGLIDLASFQLQADVIGRFGESLVYDPFEFDIVGRNLFAMFMIGIIFNILNLLIEYKFFLSWAFLSRAPSKKDTTLDVDVARERERVMSGGAASDVMRLEGLTKVYWTPGKKGKMTAVDDLYVGVPKGQCFGLLGVNGAGKTTTFKMLTGDVNVTQGDAFINEKSIRKHMVDVRQFMGYCPQFDALDPLLTGREHLEFYARVRGISPREVKSVAGWAISRLGLTRWADRISSSYSGGNKRKLSTAIALIGNPPIIFLDEPTTGMDPKARRFLWNCINSIVRAGRSVILTSHSMEECEALCSRLAIMVNGSFKCLGSTQHLKNRFGNGYTVILRVSGDNPDMSPVERFMMETFPSARLREKHCNMIQYQLVNKELSLSEVFRAMEDAKSRLGVEDYSVSQTTLDQVFINFAKKQTDLKDNELDENLNNGEEEGEVNLYEDPVDMDNMDNMDSLSARFGADSVSTGLPSEYDGQSLSGSTAELIRPVSRGSSIRFHVKGEASSSNTLSNVDA